MIKGHTNPQDAKLKENMSRIRYKVAILSGKGGVGKSTISANLAYHLAINGAEVGLLDVDIHGPNTSKMLGVDSVRFTGSEHEIDPVEVLPSLKVASVSNIGYDPDTATIWRGPMKLALIKQFLADILWGDLDYLVIDTPPGTGDEQLTIAQEIPDMTGVVIVTTPQEVALLDSRKSVDFARKLKLPVIGILENMADTESIQVFGTGGGERAAAELDVPFLGRVGLDPRMVASGDTGRPFIADYHQETAGTQLKTVVDRIVEYCKGISG